MKREDLVSRTSAKELIPLQMHPRVFAALGADLITNDIVAIVELVKNSYDAMATRVDVRFQREAEKELLEVQDNGEGMSRSIIENVWCVVATPYRTIEPIRKEGKRKRRVSGEKGLGRLSTARLGKRLAVFTRSLGEPCWHLEIDWTEIATATSMTACSVSIRECTTDPLNTETGTLVRIKDLNSEWRPERTREVAEQLSRLISPFAAIEDFSIWLTSPAAESHPVEIEPLDFLSQPPYLLTGTVDAAGNLKSQYRYSTAQGSRSKSIDTALWHEEEANRHLGWKEPLCGPFDFEIRAWDIGGESIQEIAERFELNKSTIRKDIKAHSGLSLYRDGILVLPKSDTARDWLGLDLRRVSRVGKRLSTNQMICYVAISAEKNEAIKDTSDRERLADNPATVHFKQLLTGIVEVLENERDKDRHDIRHKEPPFKDLFAALAAGDLVNGISKMVQEGRPASEIVPLVEEYTEKVQETAGEIERRLVYYSRLASLGVLSAILVHEVRNQTVVIGRLIRLLQKWSSEPAIRAIAEDIALAEKALRSLERISDRFSPLASRAFGTRRRDSLLEELISDVLAMREQDIRSQNVQVTTDTSSQTKVAIDAGELVAVLINLVDNALHWLSYNKLQQFQKLFRVKARLVDDRFEGSALEIAVVHRQGDAQFRTIGVFQDLMTAAGVMNKKTLLAPAPEGLVWACKQGGGPR